MILPGARMAEAMNTVQVLYATDRAVVGTGVPLQFANGLKADADTITYGVCQVALQSESDMNTDTASNVTEVQQESDKSWATRIEGQQVLALVHGYNNSFTDAVQGAARVKAVMPWNGPIVAFSWPSYGDGTKYLADEATYQRSLPAFSETLDVLQVGFRHSPVLYLTCDMVLFNHPCPVKWYHPTALLL